MYVLKKCPSAKRKLMSLLEEEEVLDTLDRRKCSAAVKRSYGVNQLHSGPRLGNGFVLRPEK
jgi:hypothetical protein